MKKLCGYACLILEKDNKIILLKRQNTGFSDGYWALPGGTHETCETFEQTLIREIKEEINIIVKSEDLTLTSILLHPKPDNAKFEAPEKFGFYFATNSWTGDLNNNEPDKHSDMQWFAIDDLPAKTTEYTKNAVAKYLQSKLDVAVLIKSF